MNIMGNGALFGDYSMSVKDYQVDYVYPQDNSNRSDCYSFILSSRLFMYEKLWRPSRMSVYSNEPFNLRIWNCYSETDLEAARHGYELHRQPFIYINIDKEIIGVGGNDAWGAKTEPQYIPSAKEPHQLTFVLRLE